MLTTYIPSIKIPRSILEISSDCEYVLPTYAYLAAHRSLGGRVLGTLDTLSSWCGLSASQRPTRAFPRAREALNRLRDLGYFEESKPPWCDTLPDTEFILQLDDEKFDSTSQYAILELTEIEALLGYKTQKGDDMPSIGFNKLLKVLVYIRLNQKRITVDGERFTVAIKKQLFISEDLQISPRQVSSAITVLNLLKIIDSHTMHKQCNNGGWHSYSTVFLPYAPSGNNKLFVLAQEYFSQI